MYKVRCIFISGCLLIFSCRNVVRPHTVAEPKYLAGLRSPAAANAKYYYTIVNETQTSVVVNDKKVELANKAEIGLICELLKDSAGGLVMKMTYDRLRITMKGKDGAQVWETGKGGGTVVDADAGKDEGEVGKLLSDIKGAVIVIVLSAKGDVLTIAGSKEISDKIAASMNLQDPQVRKALEQQLSKLTGEDFIKNNLAQGFKLLPDTAVYVGDNWTRMSASPGDIKFDLVTTYTLKAVEDSIARVEAASAIDDIHSTTQMMGYEVLTDLKGSQKGVFKTDLRTGLLLNGRSTISMEGTIQLSGRDLPMTITINKEITARKI